MSCAGQFEASTTPWVNLRHLMSHVPGGEEFKPCLTGVRNKNRKCQVSPAKHTFFRCLKVKSSLLRANGSEQKVQVWKLGERVEPWSLILPFRKKLTLKSRPYVLDLKTIVAPEGGGGLNEQIFKSSNAWGLARGNIEAPNWSTDRSRKSITMWLGEPGQNFLRILP